MLPHPRTSSKTSIEYEEVEQVRHGEDADHHGTHTAENG
jgi:hypothetical protein